MQMLHLSTVLFPVLSSLFVPAQAEPLANQPYMPFDSVHAYTFYSTPALYKQLKDTLAGRSAYRIYPGDHAYVLGYVNKRWYVVSRTLAKDAPRYYIRRSGLGEKRPYSPSDSVWK